MAVQQSQQPDGNVINDIFDLLGLAGCVVMTGAGIFTSYLGVHGLFPANADPFWSTCVPLAVAFAVVAFEARAKKFWDEFKANPQQMVQDKRQMVMMLLMLAAIVYDYFSSAGGTLIAMTGETSTFAAVRAATSEQMLAACVLALGYIMGPFLVSRFFENLKESPGMIGNIVRSLSL
jgi:hypothetical protein